MQQYIEIDKYLHFLTQQIALVNSSLLPKKSDDSHTNFGFNPVFRSINGRWINSGTNEYLLTLDLYKSCFVWRDKFFNKHWVIEISGKSLEELHREIEESVTALFPENPSLIKKMHYSIPDYGFDESKLKTIPIESLMLWTDCRRLANEGCLAVLHSLEVSSEIRIWPHHFDTGIFVNANNSIGIGFGLAMADSVSETPYFYISGYPSEKRLDFNEAPDLLIGNWIDSDSFMGAILSIDDIDTECSSGQLDIFIRATLPWFIQRSEKLEKDFD